jgi:thiol-disulfide isomerase/thioredoxin
MGVIALSVSGIAQGNEPPTTKSTGRIVEGRVVNDRRAPIAGAMVSLRSGDFAGFFAERETARTDSEGRYRIDLAKTGWGASRLQSMVLAPAFAYTLGTVEAGSGKATAEFALRAEPWKTTEIRLAEPSGRPGAGVDLTCVAGAVTWSRLRTDAGGRVRIAMAIGQPIEVKAMPPGARPVTVTLTNTPDGPGSITLPVLAPIRGRVHDAEGRPLPGITVGRSIMGDQGKPEVNPHFFSSTATTDHEGRFELIPTVMLTERDVDGRPDRFRSPSSICFTDPEFKRLAFGFVDLSGAVDSLDIALEPGRLIRFSIEPDLVRSLPDGTGELIVSVSPRPELPDFHLQVLSSDLSREAMRGGEKVEVRLPAGKYILSVESYSKEYRRVGQAERDLVVTAGQAPIDLPALRIESTPHQKLIGRPAPQIDATDRDTGRPVSLADFHGKVVVLDFWGYWCGPCNNAMPRLADLHRRFEGWPLAIVALHDQSVQSRADYDRRTAFA